MYSCRIVQKCGYMRMQALADRGRAKTNRNGRQSQKERESLPAGFADSLRGLLEHLSVRQENVCWQHTIRRDFHVIFK